MLFRTKGIVLHSLHYSDNRIIVKVYTEAFGLESFIATISRSKTAKLRIAMFQPLSQLDLVVTRKESGRLGTVKEANAAFPYQFMHTDIVKMSVAMFLSEFLYKTIREEEKNGELYSFLEKSLQILDLQQEGVANFHLMFLVKLTRYFGFYPKQQDGGNHFFDMKEGVFRSQQPAHPLWADAQETAWILQLMNTGFENIQNIHLNAEARRRVLQRLLQYYELHLQGMGNIQSHEVLETVLE
ncbi:MAG: DNA repair protein RecO [Bacteroidia bacterium]